MATAEKKTFDVETDPEKLVNFVCGSNYMKQGKDIELKPDNEYPDWLWTLRLGNSHLFCASFVNTLIHFVFIGKPVPLEDMDTNTLEYWRRVRKLALRRKTQLMSLRRY